MSTNDRVFHTSLGELATQPHPMGELVVGDRFVGPDETTVYEVTGDCASNNGSLRTRNLSMSADEAAALAQVDEDPRDGVFIYPPSTHLHRVQLPPRWTFEIDGVLRGPAMTQPQAEDAWAKLAAEGYDVTVVDLDHQPGHADDHADPDVHADTWTEPATGPGIDAVHGVADEPMLRAAARAYGAMTPERADTVRAAIAEVPGSFTTADLDRWGITRDEVGLVYMADLGEFDHLDTPAAGEGADPARTDPWRAPTADPWQHSAGNSASVDQQLMEERWADEYGGPWDDPRADAAHREVEGGGGRAGRDPASIRFDDPDLELCEDDPSPAHHDTAHHDTAHQGAAGAEHLDTATRTQNALDRAEATCRRIDALVAENDRAADQARAAELSRRHAADRELSGREVTDVRAVEVP